MSERRKMLLKTSVIFILVISSFPSFSQLAISDSTYNIKSSDTIDYIPSWYNGALEYNLMIAASKGLVSEIDRLVKKGASINVYNDDGATPLIFAASYNQPASVRALLKYSPRLDDFTVNWETALMIAVKNNYQDVAEALIRGGADIDFADNYGASALHYAALYGYLDMVDLLLYYDASIDTKSDEGFTPLHTAVWAGYPEIADLLIQNNANMEARDNEGDTPFLLAASNGDTLIMDMLNSFGVDIFAKNSNNQNALTLAVAYGHKDAVRYLLSRSRKWKESDTLGINPYKVASRYSRKDITEILRSYNIPGKISHSPDYISISGSARYTPHGYYSGFSVSAKDPYSNLGFKIGLDTKLWSTRIMIEESPDTYNQYYDKSSMIYGGIFKDFTLTSSVDRSSLALNVSLCGGYSFGNKFRGTNIKPETGFRIIPGTSLVWTRGIVSVFAGVEYLQTDYYKIGPLWFRTGLSFNYFPEKIKLRINKIKWG
jgi:ankyrin repeat protein